MSTALPVAVGTRIPPELLAETPTGEPIDEATRAKESLAQLVREHMGRPGQSYELLVTEGHVRAARLRYVLNPLVITALSVVFGWTAVTFVAPPLVPFMGDVYRGVIAPYVVAQGAELQAATADEVNRRNAALTARSAAADLAAQIEQDRTRVIAALEQIGSLQISEGTYGAAELPPIAELDQLADAVLASLNGSGKLPTADLEIKTVKPADLQKVWEAGAVYHVADEAAGLHLIGYRAAIEANTMSFGSSARKTSFPALLVFRKTDKGWVAYAMPTPSQITLGGYPAVLSKPTLKKARELEPAEARALAPFLKNLVL